MYTTYCLMVIYPHTKICYAYVKKEDDLASLKFRLKLYNFNIKVKGQGHTEVMNVSDTSYKGDTLMCQTMYDYVKGKRNVPRTQSHIMNPRNLI